MNIKEQLEYLLRGSVEVISEEALYEKLEKSMSSGKPLKVKAGYDPTAPDIHLGHTLLIQKMKHFQDVGHEVIFLIGDFTGMIGDPSGKSIARKKMTKKDIAKNAATYKKQIFKILDPNKTTIVFNSHWMEKMSSSDFIELTSRYTVARMLERDDFHKRYKGQQPISIHEFIYPLIQGYDSVVLKADVELGGTDQKFNLLVGRELQKDFGQEPQVVFTMPLLEGTDGVQKMSKSLDNYIGITESPKEIFGKIMSISDELMIRYYELLSDISMSEIKKMRKKLKADTVNPKKCKVKLAKEIVARFYSTDEANNAEKEFENIFKKKELPHEMPQFNVKWNNEKMWVCHLIKEIGFSKSSSEAVRLIRQGAVSINGEKITDSDLQMEKKDTFILKIGKKRFARIKPK
ncbi:MAG: tyrosine--tRNA ligase [Nitrospinota bacterium]|jgi:tyrosyl-tRNA synthetase|nr:tyrosine--tRNA ligase [Nitrospinota bacterium]MDP7581187.1 tyrosine--tRNA ligase [Nitrospinota bacterium]HJN03140.1 tyrosine--tRNA ligase [Nitrospinota bacterium]